MDPIDSVPHERPGVLRTEHTSYRGKHYALPILDPSEPVILRPRPCEFFSDAQVCQELNTLWDTAAFQKTRRPVSLGTLSADELALFSRPNVVRVLDLPIKFPDLPKYRLPRALAQFAPTIQRIIDVEHQINSLHGEYFAYLTIDQSLVQPERLHREAPCHVDGFQGARWQPKCKINHSYTVSDLLPTAYYVQPFDFTGLDEARHDYFWEMNAQVADTAEAHRWQPAEAEITLMNAYCVHRGVEATQPTLRTWLRLSFEERRRIFDRLGNAHNPLFDYAWEMVERDIEQLHLTAFQADSHPSLRVFPWQDETGQALPPGSAKTKPKLR